jgi:hypothetical protein
VTEYALRYPDELVRDPSWLVLPPLGVQLDEWLLQEGAEAVREAIGL